MNQFSQAINTPIISQFVPLPIEQIGNAATGIQKDYETSIDLEDKLQLSFSSDKAIPGSKDEQLLKKKQQAILGEIENMSQTYLKSQMVPQLRKLAVDYVADPDLNKARNTKLEYDNYVKQVTNSKISNKQAYIDRSIEEYNKTGQWNPINLVEDVDVDKELATISQANDLFNTTPVKYYDNFKVGKTKDVQGNEVDDYRLGTITELRTTANSKRTAETLKESLLNNQQYIGYLTSQARLVGVEPEQIDSYINDAINNKVNDYVTSRINNSIKQSFEELSYTDQIKLNPDGTKSGKTTIQKDAKTLLDGVLSTIQPPNTQGERLAVDNGKITFDGNTKYDNVDDALQEAERIINQQKDLADKGYNYDTVNNVLKVGSKTATPQETQVYNAIQEKYKMTVDVQKALENTMQQRVEKELGTPLIKTNSKNYSVITEEDAKNVLNELGFSNAKQIDSKDINVDDLKIYESESVNVNKNFNFNTLIDKKNNKIYFSYDNHLFLINDKYKPINPITEYNKSNSSKVKKENGKLVFVDDNNKPLLGIRLNSAKQLFENIEENSKKEFLNITERYHKELNKNLSSQLFSSESSEFRNTFDFIKKTNDTIAKIKKETLETYVKPYNINYPTVILNDQSQKEISSWFNKFVQDSKSKGEDGLSNKNNSIIFTTTEGNPMNDTNYKSLTATSYFYDIKEKKNKFFVKTDTGLTYIAVASEFNNNSELTRDLEESKKQLFSAYNLLQSIETHPKLTDFKNTEEELEFDSEYLKQYGFRTITALDFIRTKEGVFNTRVYKSDGTTQDIIQNKENLTQLYRDLYKIENSDAK